MPLYPAETVFFPPDLTEEQMLRSMGIGKPDGVKPRLLRHVADTIPVVAARARPGLLWRSGSVDAFREVFPSSIRLNRYLATADHVTVLVGSAGREMEALITEEPDPMRKYVLGVASTALARRALRVAETLLGERFPNCIVGRPLSPGNDGLPLALQGPLLKCLPIDRLGLVYDEAAMVMVPLASVSALIGLGSYIRNSDEGCPTCPSADCVVRLAPRLPAGEPVPALA
ncbi:MAG: hypothetical protein R3F07_06240 [Opitutaceae bacterium]